jgi:hypothetical protein
MIFKVISENIRMLKSIIFYFFLAFSGFWEQNVN